MKKTKVALILAAIIILTIVLVACNPGDVYKNGTSTIKIISINDKGGEVKFSKVYSTDNGILNGNYKFTIESKSGNTYKLKINIDGTIYNETYNSNAVTFCGKTYVKS